MNIALRLALLTCLLAGMATLTSAQDNSPQPLPTIRRSTQRDKDKTEPTADQQKENPSDRDIAQQIRKSVMKDKSLSTYAHNVKSSPKTAW
jgi:hypothetical protein